MSIRAPAFNRSGTIDCEIDHPDFGWIPFTASPDDPEEHGRAIYEAAWSMGPSPYVAPATTSAVLPRIVYKADIWRRATDDEAEAMDAMLDSQPVRLRRMWADAVHLQSDDELFATIDAALIAQFGVTRAAELLA